MGGCHRQRTGACLVLRCHLATVIMGLCLMTGGFFAMQAVCSGLVGKVAGPHKAQATSLYLLAFYIGSSAQGYAGGWLWDHGRRPALSVGLMTALAVFIALVRAIQRQPGAPGTTKARATA